MHLKFQPSPGNALCCSTKKIIFGGNYALEYLLTESSSQATRQECQKVLIRLRDGKKYKNKTNTECGERDIFHPEQTEFNSFICEFVKC